MPTPTIPDGRTAFNISLSNTGTTSGPGGGVAKVINGLAFQPDMVWSKNRSSSTNARWGVIDSVRGVNKTLSQNNTFAEVTSQTDLLTSFNSNGVNIGADAGGYGWNWNQQSGASDNYAYWLWKESVSAGFDIVTYTGNGTSQWVNHSLGVAPQMIIIKSSSTVTNWIVYQAYTNAVPYNYYLQLNTTSAAINSGSFMGADPTPTQFNVGSLGDVNNSGSTFVAYCFAPVAGYSAFGSYTGNGSTDGTFIYTGFRPRFVIIKSSTFAGADWVMYDSARNTYNALTSELVPNDAASENNYGGAARMDFVSNGIKMRTAGAGLNNSGSTYIYMAFAENPFKYANAR